MIEKSTDAPQTPPGSGITGTEFEQIPQEQEVWSTPSYHGKTLEAVPEVPNMTGDIYEAQVIPRVVIRDAKGQPQKATHVGTRQLGGQEYHTLSIGKNVPGHEMVVRRDEVDAYRKERHVKRDQLLQEAAALSGAQVVKLVVETPKPVQTIEPFNDPFSNARKRPLVVRNAQAQSPQAKKRWLSN